LRIRARFTKDGPARFASTLDFARMLARAATRAAIPMEYSQGHTRRPRISTGPALPVGIRSSAEYADFRLSRDLGPEEFRALLGPALPPGVELLGAWELPEGSKSLCAAADAAEYRCRGLQGERALSVASALSAGPARECRVLGDSLVMILDCSPAHTVNPVSALQEAGVPREESLSLDIERSALYTMREGRIVPPEDGNRGGASSNEERDADKRGRDGGPCCDP